MIGKIWCPILVLTIILFKFVTCNRCESWSRILDEAVPDEARYTCYQQQLANECKFEINKTEVKIHNPNEEGTMNFEFDYEPNCKYLLNAFIWPEVNNEDSCHNQNERDASQHSKYIYTGINEFNVEDSQNKCTERENITVKFLFTGCYHFRLVKSRQVVFTHRRYLTIHQNKLNFSDFDSESHFYVQHRNIDSTTILEIQHPFLKDNPNLNLRINCTNCNTPSYGVYRITPTLSNTSTTMEYNLYCYKNESENVKMHCQTVRVDSIKCIATGLNNGLYEIAYQFKNLIRCPGCIYCIWNTCHQITEKQISGIPVLPIPNESNKFPVIYYVLLGLIFAGLILTLAFLIYIWCKYKKPVAPNIPISYTEGETLIGKNKVLLLYPKDADIVMETMKTLRIALKAEGFEVYDIYDQNQQKSIDEVKEKWIIDKLSDKYMKTVIVQTYCGQILSNSSHSAQKLYKKPTCYDDFFPYALSLIRARVDPNCYTKLFVANMGFDKINYTEFEFLNPCVRYGLPQNFKELTRDLHHQQHNSVNISQNKNKLREFTFMCRNMKNFIDDPNYLTDILHVSVFKIGDKIRIDEPCLKM